MRRIPWLAVAVLAGLLVVTLPLASAQPAPFTPVPGLYLPLVYQPPLPTTTLVPEFTREPAPTLTRTATSLPPGPTLTPTRNAAVCAAEYPTVCIPPPPPDLNCGDIPYRRFTVLPPDRHRFDSDGNGVGCETP
jgi:hypothetical protein